MANVNMGANAKYQAELVHSGVCAAVFRISASVSISGGDVMLIGKLPVLAIPLDAVFYPNAQIVAKFGTSISQEAFLISATYSTVARVTTQKLGTAAQVSLSDDAAVRYDNVTMVATGGASLAYIGDLVVYYRMPGQRF